MMSNYKKINPSDCKFSWVIVQLDCAPSYEGLQDYVVNVHWRYGAQFESYYTDLYGAQSFNEVAGPDFTPYAELTESQVIGWLENSLDMIQIQDQLVKTIENMVNPPIVVLPLPWESKNQK
jgi:spore cortex formation protein SpoVR/YcgB (stage V sporulation)